MTKTPSAILTLAATCILALVMGTASAASAPQGIDSDSFVRVSRKVLPSVVNITIEPKDDKLKEEVVDEEVLRYFLEGNEFDGPFYDQVSGSGVLIHREDGMGYVLTNEHVISPLDDESVMKLTFHQLGKDGSNYDETTVIMGDALRIIGRDKLSDLAVIEFLIPEALGGLEPVPFGDSNQTEIGEFVLALGNPLNFNHTITQGIISGKSRYLRDISIERLLQTDAVIQPGNSGGPLVNLNGEIVGINNAIMSRTGLWQGTSFAIPSNDAKRISFQLIDEGRVIRGYLGVTMQDVRRYRELYKKYDLDLPLGVLVTYVVPNSPADVAGIHSLDVITEIDGEKLRSPDHLLQIITSQEVNSEIDFRVVRIGDTDAPSQIKMSAVLSERPNEEILRELHQTDDRENFTPFLEGDAPETEMFFGLELDARINRQMEIAGLEVINIEPGSPAEAAGFQKGDIITQLEGRAVSTERDLKTAIAQVQAQRDDNVLEFFVMDESGSVAVRKITIDEEEGQNTTPKDRIQK